MTETAAQACYLRTDRAAGPGGILIDTFAPTACAASPWGPDLQHGGPVTGLLARAMDQLHPREDARISRVNVEILGPVRMSDVEVTARIERPGRRIELLAAEMRQRGKGGTVRPVARAAGWRLRTGATASVTHHAEAAIPGPGENGNQLDGALPESWLRGFVGALDWQVRTPFWQPGTPTTAWTRLRLVSLRTCG